jgi:hypothetical protein
MCQESGADQRRPGAEARRRVVSRRSVAAEESASGMPRNRRMGQV